MKIEEIKVISDKLVLPRLLSLKMKLRYPFYQIPKLNDYSKRIVNFSKKNRRLPFFSKFDINNDGKEEIMIIHKSIIGGHGRLLIISEHQGRFKFNRIKWRRPVNSLFFDYYIDMSEPKKYQTFGLVDEEDKMNLSYSMKARKVNANHPHIITKGYLERIVYWNGKEFRQERVGKIIND